MSGSIRAPRRRRAVRLAAGCLTVLFFLGAPVAPPAGTPREPRHEQLRVGLPYVSAGARGRLSAVTASPWTFSLVGLTWHGSERPPGTPSLRTSLDGKSWTAWTDLEPMDAAPDRGSPERSDTVSTEPLWVDRARFAQVRWTGAVPPPSLALHVIDPGQDPRGPAASAAAAPSRPGIVSRAQWGADESIRRCCPTFAPKLDFAVVHHTATTNSYGPGDSSSIVRSVYEYHVRVNGWADIGYNFLVDRFGRVFEGRHGGIAEAVIGAHSEGFNTGSTGVALIGSFQSTPPTSAALTSLKNLLAWKLDVHHVDPRGKPTVVSRGSRKHPAGRSVRVNAVAAHRDLQETSCPGDRVMETLSRVRSDAYGIGLPKIFRPEASPSVFTPNADGSGDTLRITAAVSDGASWRVRVRSPGNTIVQTWTGSGNPDVRWDGRTAAGEAAPHAYYEVEITATRGGGSATPAEIRAGLYRDPWGQWTRLGDLLEPASASPRLSTGPNGTYHLIAREGGGGLRHGVWSNGAWTTARLGRAIDRAAPDGRLGLAQGSDGVIHALIRGRNSNLYHGRILRDGGFTGWSRVGGSGDRGTDLSLAVDGSGTVHAMVVGLNGGLYANRYRGGWSSWRRVGNSNDRGTFPVLTTGRQGDVLAVVVGRTLGIHANKINPGGGWLRRWSRVGSAAGYGHHPAVAAVAEGFVVTVRGRSFPSIWHTTGTIGMWSSWSRVGRAGDSGYEPAAATAQEDVVLIVRGRTSGRLYTNVRTPGGGWQGWDEAGDTQQQGAWPALAANGTNVMLAAEVAGEPPVAVLATPPLRTR